ncbi:flowering locus K homology domain-like [Solanum pennellii]|uniref:Flowering locus K homology domain-like n=1 Tax=Solanum pennellii TaxID=28526 RepID=A0ABM1FS73_SOLPN|nr:flowering locus K homology domain-like [Solanum pennellii]
MANSQQIETSINPSPNPPPPGSPPSAAAVVSRPSDDETNRSATAKRSREEYASAATDEAGLSGDDVPPLKKRVKVSQDVVYRIVVPSRQIGKVIGKAGHRIQKIREETKATIKVADAIARHEERVIIISSKDNDDMFSDAENALHQIVSLILKDDGNLDAQKVGAGHVAANTVRFLIAGSQAGGLIGMSGQNIGTLRNSSGATITVLAQHQLPLCASAHESDRVVQLAGDIPAVLRAVVEIGCQLRDNPPKQVISISPTYNLGYSRPPQPHVDPSSAEYVNLTMLVPESLAGGLIGRCGSNISRIRAESGATIKVHGGKGEQKQRQVHLGGSAQQVALAKQRVDEYVYSQLMLQAGGEQLQDTMQLQQQSMQLQQSMHLQHSMQMQQQIPNTSATLMPGYNHGHGVYMNSNQEAHMMASYPQVYTSTNPQAPGYYGQSYPAPQM